jgi:molybdate transport system substrate-binding protein
VLRNAGLQDRVLPNVVSNEEDVASVVTKVVSGDADAGIAYVTDATSVIEGSVAVVPIPDDARRRRHPSIAVSRNSADTDLAQRFVDFVLGSGRAILDSYGFSPP